MCDKCVNMVKLKEEHNKKSKQNEQLVDELIRESGYNNEYDNRNVVQRLREEILKRMR